MDQNNYSEGVWNKVENIENLFINTDAVIILTEWEEYSKIDWENQSKKMNELAWIFDSRSVVNPQDVINAGLNFWRLGDGVT